MKQIRAMIKKIFDIDYLQTKLATSYPEFEWLREVR
jgi:hypothetical protein